MKTKQRRINLRETELQLRKLSLQIESISAILSRMKTDVQGRVLISHSDKDLITRLNQGNIVNQIKPAQNEKKK